jgi:Calcineurin-like phosphoesterase
LTTLVLSDLHLGNRAQRDVVRVSVVQERLLDALAGIDRLVLLGDLAELVTRSPRRSLAIAEPVLRAIGRRLGPGKEVIFVPGNHDGPLVRAWARAQGRSLSAAAEVPLDATRGLERVTSWLGPSPVRVRYPGVWLDERTYAIHGHYLDHHLLPESPIGLPRGRLRQRPASLALPADYERGRIRSHHGRDALQRPLSMLAGSFHRTLVPALPQLLMRARLASVTASLADAQMRHAALPALRRVLARLELEPEIVLFGHIHRRGPLEGDRDEDWQPAAGAQVLNTGSWLYEPLLTDRVTPPHPYWPGGAVLIADGSPPRSLGLLDDLPPRSLGLLDHLPPRSLGLLDDLPSHQLRKSVSRAGR